MSKMSDYMMDVENFCDGYFYGGMKDFTIDEVVEDVNRYFGFSVGGDEVPNSGDFLLAGLYARNYLLEKLGEVNE
jgi:hypothetical protein